MAAQSSLPFTGGVKRPHQATRSATKPKTRENCLPIQSGVQRKHAPHEGTHTNSISPAHMAQSPCQPSSSARMSSPTIIFTKSTRPRQLPIAKHTEIHNPQSSLLNSKPIQQHNQNIPLTPISTDHSKLWLQPTNPVTNCAALHLKLPNHPQHPILQSTVAYNPGMGKDAAKPSTSFRSCLMSSLCCPSLAR